MLSAQKAVYLQSLLNYHNQLRNLGGLCLNS